MSIGTGWLMISLKNFSPNSILLSHSDRFDRACASDSTRTQCLSATDELTRAKLLRARLCRSTGHAATKEPPHLIAEPGVHALPSLLL